MKRKRVAEEMISKTVTRKFPVVDSSNYVHYVTEENSESDEFDDSSEEECNTKFESDTSSSSSSLMETDGSSDNEDTDSGYAGILEKIVSKYGKAKHRTRILSKGAKNLKLNKKAKHLLTKQGKAKSKEFGSSSRKRKKSKARHQEPPYCKKELKVSLAVIKKVMKMEEAKPFSVPMDPVALGIPDYFDVIEAPMDFSTICSNLQSGIKYMNAEDVLKDVQIIWENCRRYNKKGECILILMKRVEEKFMKYWTAAGLYGQQKWKIKWNSQVLPSMDSPMTCSRHEPRCQVSSMLDSTSQMQWNHSGSSQLQPQFPSSCCTQPYHLQQQPQPSTKQPGSYQFHGDCGGTEHLHSQPNTESAMNHCKYVPQRVVDSMISSPTKSQSQWPQMSHNEPYCSQQFKKSPSQLQPSQTQAGADIDPAEHSHFQPPINHTTRRNETVLMRPADTLVVKPSQLQHQQPMLSDSQPNELLDHQTSFDQFQLSQSQTCADFDFSEYPLGLSNSAQRHLVDPMIDCPSKQPQFQLGSSKPKAEPAPHSQQPSQSLNQQYESRHLSEKKGKGRGPAKCQFLRDLRDGERIKVPVNSQGEPVGPESTKLSSFLGIIARNGHVAPLTVVSWKVMPEEAKKDMWECVQSKFEIDSRCKTWILNSIAKKWKNWKAELKENHYYPHKTDEDRLTDLNPRVLPEQWPVLVSYWSSEQEKLRSAKNKANRAKCKSGHTSGRKSYARLREEEQMKRPNGGEPTQAELYILTHTRKNGQPANEEAAGMITQLQDQANQQKSSEGRDEYNNPDIGNERHGSAPIAKGSTTNDELTMMLKKIEAMELKFAHMETLITRVTSILQRGLLDKRPVSNAALKTSDTIQVPSTSSAPENTPESQSLPHSSSSSQVTRKNI